MEKTVMAYALKILGCMVAGTLLVGCGGDSSTRITENRSLALDFRALNTTVTPAEDMTADICSATLSNVGTSGADASIAYMAFYVSDVKLITAAGDKVAVELDDNRVTQEQGVALVDFRNKKGACSGEVKTVDHEVTGRYEYRDGDVYTGIEFQLGLPASINHADVNLAGILSKAVDMHWNWLGGYRYLRMDVDPVGGVMKPDESMASRWTVHLGATGCSNGGLGNQLPPTNACDNANLTVIALDEFNPETSKISVDIAALFSGSDLSRDAGGSVGCMSGTTDPECDEVFARLGLTHPMQGGDFTTPVQQVIFSVIND